MTIANGRRVDSPLEAYPGYVVLPVELTPLQFDKWWRAAKAAEAEGDGDVSDWFQAWRMRYHFVLEWHIDGVRPEQVTPDGMKMPSMKLIAWIDRITRGLVEDALDLPKSPAPLKGAENGSAPETETMTAQPA